MLRCLHQPTFLSYCTSAFCSLFRVLLNKNLYFYNSKILPLWPQGQNNLIFSHLRVRLLSGLHTSGFSTKTLYAFFLFTMHATCPPIVSSLALSYSAKSTGNEAPHYAIFSNLLPFHPSRVQILSSAFCSQTPSVYDPPQD
jgi:hypothetical protein